MEAVAALGLASNAISFVDFALKLFSTTREIAGSVRGATEENEHLANVYTTLETLASRLDTAQVAANSNDSHQSSGHGGPTRSIEAHAAALRAIAADCRVTCNEMLQVVRGLMVKEDATYRRLKCFGAAFKTALSARKMEGLETKLKRFQRMIALHFFPLLRFVHTTSVPTLQSTNAYNQ